VVEFGKAGDEGFVHVSIELGEAGERRLLPEFQEPVNPSEDCPFVNGNLIGINNDVAQ
jgi:hypothetical protein